MLADVRFGIFFELSVPPPFDGAGEQQVYENTVEQAVVADALGVRLGVGGRASLPRGLQALLLTRAVPDGRRGPDRTDPCRPRCGRVRARDEPSRARRRTGRRTRHRERRPARAGTARSSTWTELGGFGIDPDLTKKTWDEYVRMLPKMWCSDRFSFEGIGCQVPERNVLPKPVQDPHPPMWVTVTTPGTELDAADGHRVPRCRRGDVRRAGTPHGRVPPSDRVWSRSAGRRGVTTQNFLYCHEDIDHAAAVGGRMAAAFSLLNAHLLWTREAYPTSAYQSLGNLAPPAAKKETGAPGERRPLPEGVAIGDPGRIIEEIERWDSVGIDGINFMLNAMEQIPQQEVLDSLRLFAAEVMPKFKA